MPWLMVYIKYAGDALAMTRETERFLGLRFEAKSVADVIRHIGPLARVTEPFGYVVTPNVDHMVRLEGDDSLRVLYEAADILLNDSRILEILARRDGLDLPASPGADIVAALLDGEIAPDDPITIIGTEERDIDAIRARFGLTKLAWHAPPMGLRNKPEAIEEAAAFMAEHPARFHFLCVGSPQQEMVAYAAKRRGDVVGLGLCCGASFDFLSGKTARAPKWIREMRLEWLHRMLSEPKRLTKRYLVDGPRILAIWRTYRTPRR
jgi:exopolysaccharide biosynthesis WecB/TagA/CpsF family protein